MSVRVGTWNVEYARVVAKNERRLSILKEKRADIWVLTETHDDLDLGPSHTPIRSLRRPMVRERASKAGDARWVTMWTAYPVRKILGVQDEERTVAALVDTPVGLLIIYGTVLPWHSDRGKHPEGIVVPNWSEFYRVIDEQAREWTALRQASPGVPLCVAGDLNVNLGGPHWYGTNRGRDLLRKVMQENDLVCTTEYSRIAQGALEHPPIDHVLISTELGSQARVAGVWEGSTADGVRLSDHSGLVVEVSGRA